MAATVLNSPEAIRKPTTPPEREKKKIYPVKFRLAA
jgi:hypothetical protein